MKYYYVITCNDIVKFVTPHNIMIAEEKRDHLRGQHFLSLPVYVGYDYKDYLLEFKWTINFVEGV